MQSNENAVIVVFYTIVCLFDNDLWKFLTSNTFSNDIYPILYLINKNTVMEL